MSPEEHQARVNAIAAHVQRIQGWVHDNDCSALYQLARDHAPVPTVVELGSWRGRSTIWLAAAMHDRGGGRVYAVDTWRGTEDEALHQQLLAGYDATQLYREFLGNMAEAGVSSLVEARRMTTAEAARLWPTDQPIGLLFIDAAHDYLDVRRDFELWSPFIPVGGFLALDDTTHWEGPARVVQELPGWFKPCFTGQNIWIGQKTS